MALFGIGPTALTQKAERRGSGAVRVRTSRRGYVCRQNQANAGRPTIRILEGIGYPENKHPSSSQHPRSTPRCRVSGHSGISGPETGVLWKVQAQPSRGPRRRYNRATRPTVEWRPGHESDKRGQCETERRKSPWSFSLARSPEATRFPEIEGARRWAEALVHCDNWKDVLSSGILQCAGGLRTLFRWRWRHRGDPLAWGHLSSSRKAQPQRQCEPYPARDRWRQAT